jgi:hypothetical protein
MNRGGMKGNVYHVLARAYFCSFKAWMRGFHDLVRGKQSSLLTFWEGAWTLSLCWWTGPCIWAFWPKYWHSAALHDWPYLFCVEPQQTYMAGRDRCDPCLNWLPCLSHIHRQYCIHLVCLRLGHPWWAKEGWRTTFTGGPLSSFFVWTAPCWRHWR